jgi:septum formation protein
MPLQFDKVILASASPRRKELMLGLGWPIEVCPSDLEEDFPSDMPLQHVPAFLAEKKAKHVAGMFPNEVVLAADTVVIVDGEILGKPVDKLNAQKMLRQLSGKAHEVVTGVCICYQGQCETFSDLTKVYFKHLTDNEIDYYIDHYKPYDKAGAYGVQEWIGYVAVEKMDGSFYNVMGLPVNKVYDVLSKWK